MLRSNCILLSGQVYSKVFTLYCLRVLLAKKLSERGYRVEREKDIPIIFEGVFFEVGFRPDLVINECFNVELKSVEKLASVHAKQLLTYLKLSNLRLGLLINFGEELLKNGIKRIAN